MEMSIILMILDLELVVEDRKRLLQREKRLVLSWKIRRIEILFLHLSVFGGGLISDTKHDYLEWKKLS